MCRQCPEQEHAARDCTTTRMSRRKHKDCSFAGGAVATELTVQTSPPCFVVTTTKRAPKTNLSSAYFAIRLKTARVCRFHSVSLKKARGFCINSLISSFVAASLLHVQNILSWSEWYNDSCYGQSTNGIYSLSRAHRSIHTPINSVQSALQDRCQVAKVMLNSTCFTGEETLCRETKRKKWIPKEEYAWVTAIFVPCLRCHSFFTGKNINLVWKLSNSEFSQEATR